MIERLDTVKKITLVPQTIYIKKYNTIKIADKTVLLRNTALEALRQYGTDTTRRMYFTEYSTDNPHEILHCAAIPPDCKVKTSYSSPPAKQ